MQASDDLIYKLLKLEKLDFEKRMAVEQEIEKYWDQSNKQQEELNQNNSTYACYMPNL